MSRLARPAAAAMLPLAILLAGGAPAAQPPDAPAIQSDPFDVRAGVRLATFNASLHRRAAGRLAQDLAAPGDAQARAVAQIIQRVRPDVLLICEFDHDIEGVAAGLFQKNYLSVSQDGAEPIEYGHVFRAPVNTGVPSGLDLDNDGATDGPGDALGYGVFPGQYGMLLLSRYPILAENVRTFQSFLWKDMPGALLPDDPATPEAGDWYTAQELAALRLSSKSHWDVPIDVDGRVIHVLASHPTPPVFDGPEDRNGRRNHDEIRFWADYVAPERSAYIHDDAGRRGGLEEGTHFVIMGDLNADPLDGDSVPGAAGQLLDDARINARRAPASRGAIEAARLQGGTNAQHRGQPAFDTADFADTRGAGNLRTDYVLPSRSLPVVASGVFWPARDEPLFALVGTHPSPSSDHRLVWVDLDR